MTFTETLRLKCNSALILYALLAGIVLLFISLDGVSAEKTISYISNGGFERGAANWSLSGEAELEASVARTGDGSLKIGVGSAYYDILDLRESETYTCSGAMKLKGVRETKPRGYAFMAVYQFDDFGEIVAFLDFAQKTGTADWQRYTYTFEVVDGCRVVSIRCGLFRAVGTVWLDDFTLVAGKEAADFSDVTEEDAIVAELPGFEPKPKGNAAIYRDDIPTPTDGTAAPSSPDYLAGVLQRAHYGVAFIGSAQLADKKALNRASFDIVILPYGPSFPVEAADNFRRFLRTGGKFVSMGGYAFDDLLERTKQGWRKPIPPKPPKISDVRWRCEIPAEELRGRGEITFSGFMKTLNVSGEHFAFFAVYQFDSERKLVQWKDVCQIRGSIDWHEYSYAFSVNEKAAVIDLYGGLFRCRGIAWFDDIKLTDEKGNVLLDSDFEEEFDPDKSAPHNWWRPNPELCEVDSRVAHSGKKSLKTKLHYYVPQPERLNTRSGRPRDGLDVAPTQLGVFDADHRLERVSCALPARGQFLIDPETRINEPLEGYAASGVVGSNAARWIPLINAYDKYGRLRGAVGAMLRHYSGIYQGSSWAFFGVTNKDIFVNEDMKVGLVNIVRSLIRDTYFAALLSDHACYRQGEAVTLRAPIFNGGREGRSLQVAFEVSDGAKPSVAAQQKTAAEPLWRAEIDVPVPPGQTKEATAKWSPGKFGSDIYRVVATMREAGSEKPFDQIEGGFIVWNESVVASGPKLRYENNYLHYGQKPLFLFGADDWGYVFSQNRETPWQWFKDAQKRQDFGVNIYENLQIGLPANPKAREEFFRKVDGIVQLTQKYQQVYFPCLLCGFNVAVSDEELAKQKEFCRAYAKRYAKTPGLIYYLNGDLRCLITEAVTPEWNQFLRERYGTIQKLRQAWADDSLKQFGRIPAKDYSPTDWDDVRAYDTNLFRAWLIRRWTSELIGAIREFDKGHPTTAEFYKLPWQGVDVLAGIGELDLSNIGYFDRPNDDIRRFPSILKYSDLRSRGKSLGPGEYGVKTHPAWGDGKDYNYHTTRTREQANELFLAIAHYSLGLGASRIQNWCWKDSAHRIFPWGMTYPCDNVEKDILYVHRDQSLLFRRFSPIYEIPSVYVLTADTHRLGGQKDRVIDGILNGINLALAAHVDNLGMLNEHYLEIPEQAKVIFYPLPYCPTDKAYAKVCAFVRSGGTLYVSGDISYDETRRRTRQRRLKELCGVEFVRENYRNITYSELERKNIIGVEGTRIKFSPGYPCIGIELSGAEALARGQDGTPIVVRHKIGRGQVIFTTDPLELHTKRETLTADAQLYREVLALAGVKPISLAPDDPLIHVFRVSLRNGGQVYVLFNTNLPASLRLAQAGEGQPKKRITLGDCQPPISLEIAKRRPALVWLDGEGSIRAVEALGDVRVGDDRILRADFNVSVCSLDGGDLRDSRALMVIPSELEAGRVAFAFRGTWREPVAEAGEVRGGRWRSFELAPFDLESAELTVTEDQARSIILLCERERLSYWRDTIRKSMVDPASLP